MNAKSGLVAALPSKTLTLAAFFCLVLLALYGWISELPYPNHLRDFGSFVASGRAVLDGKNPYEMQALTNSAEFAGVTYPGVNLNPPVLLPLFVQLARIDIAMARLGWFLLSVVCYVLALYLLGHEYGLTPVRAIWAVCLAGFWLTLGEGQIYTVLALLSTLAWLFLKRGQPVIAGILIGVIAAIKPNFLIWPALLLLAGNIQVTAASIGTVVLMTAAPAVFYGPAVYADWGRALLSMQLARFPQNASLLGLTTRLGVPWLGLVLSGILLAAIAVWALRTRPAVHRASAVALVCGILVSPIGWVGYTLLMLPAMLFRRRWSFKLSFAAALLVFPASILWGQAQLSPVHLILWGAVYPTALLLVLWDSLNIKSPVV